MAARTTKERMRRPAGVEVMSVDLTGSPRETWLVWPEPSSTDMAPDEWFERAHVAVPLLAQRRRLPSASYPLDRNPNWFVNARDRGYLHWHAVGSDAGLPVYGFILADFTSARVTAEVNDSKGIAIDDPNAVIRGTRLFVASSAARIGDMSREWISRAGHGLVRR